MSSQQQRWVLPRDRSAAAQARRLMEGVCAGLPGDSVDAARLLVSELVANAVLHGAGSVVLAVTRDGEAIRVEVSDGNPKPPVLVEGNPFRESGAGLRLVDALAADWGTAPRADGQPGKQVWFTLA